MTYKAVDRTKVDVEARKKLLLSLFTTAVEGGIGHWSECSEYSWMLNHDEPAEMPVEDLDGFRAVLHPADPEEAWGVFDGGDDEQPLTVDKAVIERGLARWIEWMTTDRRNHVGGIVDADSSWKWQRESYSPTNSYWRQFASDAKFNRFEDIDFDADIADAVVQLGLFDEVVFG